MTVDYDSGMDDIIAQLGSVVSSWDTLGTLAGMIAVVNLLVNLTKLKWLSDKVPAKARPWIALGLGALGGFLTALAASKSIPQAVVQGILNGMAAIGTHELMSQMINKNVLPGGQAEAAKAMIIIWLGVGFTTYGLSACGTKTGAQLEHGKNALIDCAKHDIGQVVGDGYTLLGKVTSVVVQGGDGWKDQLKSLGTKAGEHALACAVKATQAVLAASMDGQPVTAQPASLTRSASFLKEQGYTFK